MDREEAIWENGRSIAKEIGQGVVYNGPQFIGDLFVYHMFTDKEVTGTTFTGMGVLDSKATLMVHRMNFNSPIPNFPEITDPVGVVKKAAERLNKVLNDAFSRLEKK